MNDRGVTLVELLVAVSVVVILAVALAFSYQNWMGRYNVEKAIRGIYSDLIYARQEAMTKAHTYFVDFPTTTSYRMSVDDYNGTDKSHGGDGTFQPQTDPAVSTATTDTTEPTFPKTVPYTMYAYSYNGPAAAAAVTAKTLTNVLINFDDKGHMSSPTLLVDPANPLDATTNQVVTGIISLTSDPTDLVGNMHADYDCLVISPTQINIGQMQTEGTLWRCNVK